MAVDAWGQSPSQEYPDGWFPPATGAPPGGHVNKWGLAPDVSFPFQWWFVPAGAPVPTFPRPGTGAAGTYHDAPRMRHRRRYPDPKLDREDPAFAFIVEVPEEPDTVVVVVGDEPVPETVAVEARVEVPEDSRIAEDIRRARARRELDDEEILMLFMEMA